MPRARTHADATRTKMVSVRLREETYDRVSAEAVKLGLSRAGYLEHLAENKPVTVDVLHADALSTPLINELKRVGNNLNQMAHATNTGWPPTEKAMLVVLHEIIAVLTRDELTRRRFSDAQEVATRERAEASRVDETERRKITDTARAVASAPPRLVPREPAIPTPYPDSPFVHRDDFITDAPLVPGAGPGGPVTIPPEDAYERPSYELKAAPPYKPMNNKARHDPPPSPKRFKLPWSLFVRSPRR